MSMSTGWLVMAPIRALQPAPWVTKTSTSSSSSSSSPAKSWLKLGKGSDFVWDIGGGVRRSGSLNMKPGNWFLGGVVP